MKDPLAALAEAKDDGSIPEPVNEMVWQLLSSYQESLVQAGKNAHQEDERLHSFIAMVKEQVIQPFPFDYYHKKVVTPLDYYHYGVDFIRPIVDLEKSKVLGTEHLDVMTERLKAGENVILFGNHQVEFDPQVLSLLLSESHPHIAENVIFVAGHRVTTDPMAIPFSMGRNLLCIFSKRHIDKPPEQRAEKQRHNQRTMKAMSELLSAGGQCIYVAPSGGRDRRNDAGQVQLAPVDPAAVEMFALMAKRAKTPTHFYPLSLDTYNFLPPPQTIRSALGEPRHLSYSPVHAAFGALIAMDTFPGYDHPDKKERRALRAQHIQDLIETNYQRLTVG